MILTVTLNPSIDISYRLKKLQWDDVNRVTEVSKTPGGKGLNVTRVLAELGESVTATGLIGGATGECVKNSLEKLKIDTNFFQISGETRNCVAILHEGKQTEILESGPLISFHEMEGFFNHLEKMIKKYRVITISGSLPEGIPSTYYMELISLVNKYDKKVVLDCSGKALLDVLNSDLKPFVIKPNIQELSQVMGQKISNDTEELKTILDSDLFSGIEWIIVSLGAKGSFAKHDDKFYKVYIPSIKIVNPVGSGDSTVAGIASAILHGEKDIDMLKKANTLGMLNAQEKVTGHINMDNFADLFNLITVEEV